MPYALVMGASGDIGQAVCEKLAGQGWSLYCHFNQQKEKVLNFVSDLQKRYPQQDFFMVSLDMLREAEIPNFLDQLFQVDGIVLLLVLLFMSCCQRQKQIKWRPYGKSI